MENLADIICRLCLNVINGGNYKIIEETTREVLAVLLNLSLEAEVKPIMCTVCSMNLFEAHQFKVSCMDTEHNISSLVNSENKTPVDLREICLKESGKEHLGMVMEDEQICRLCMHIVTSGFVSVKDVEIDMIQTCIPEINFNFTADPVICVACLDSLNIHSRFLKKCLVVEEQIKQFHNDKEILYGIKSEEVEIKSEKNEDSDNEVHNDKLVEGMNQLIRKYVSDVRLHKCDTCAYKTKRKDHLVRHQLTHKNNSKVQVHECDVCGYKTYRKDRLTHHLLQHKCPTEVEMYSCGICGFQTKYKHYLSLHERMHKDSSEIQKYKCDGTQLYKCDMCDYKSDRKANLARHQLKHKSPSEVDMYTCDECGFETKHKRQIKIHQLKHKGLPETQLYECYRCNYKTKWRAHMVRHQLSHKSPSEVQMYSCSICSYKTKFKNNLPRHQLRHKHSFQGGDVQV